MRKKISRSFLIWQLLYIYQSVSPSEFHHIWCVITLSRWNRTFGNIIGTLNIFIYSTPQNTAKAKRTLWRGKNINDNHYITSFMQNRIFIPFSFAFESIFLGRKSVKTQVSSDLMAMWYWKVICPGKNTCTNWEGGQQPHFTQSALPSVSSKLQIKWSVTRPIEVSNLFLHYFPCWLYLTCNWAKLLWLLKPSIQCIVYPPVWR